MGFNLDALAVRIDGTPAMIAEARYVPKNGELPPLVQATWKRLVVDALNARFDEDRHKSLADLMLRGRLARKVQRGGEITLKAESVTIIKDCVSRAWAPDLVIQICELIDPAEAKSGDDGI